MALAVSSSTSSSPTSSSPISGPESVAAGSADRIDELTTLARSGAIVDGKDLALALAEAESIQRRAHALSIDLLAVSEANGLHYLDGHASAKIMTRHVNKLSGAEAAGRDRCRRMFADLHEIAAAYRAGTVGTDQVMVLARVWSNPRVRHAMGTRQGRFLKDARRLSFPRFRDRVLEWQRITDEDGAEPARNRTFENRNAQLVQNHFDESWDMHAILTSGDGAAMKEVLDAYCRALFEADWAEAREQLGDAASLTDLSRTNAQRRADALRQIFADAIGNKAGLAPAGFTHSIVWSAETFEEMVRRFHGGTPQPFDPETYRCETSNGVAVDPTEAFANAVVNKIRRVVIDAKGVVIDLGQARLFTSFAKEAVRLSGRECYWPGCWVPASRCESDHLKEHSGGGRTCPGNGAPCCGRHNRWKQKGYRVWRDDAGQIHVHRPDGTVID